MDDEFGQDFPLDNYDVDDDNLDPLPNEQVITAPVVPAPTQKDANNDNDLSATKARKKRKPMKKVDVELLLSEEGLPYLKREGPKLKFSAKGDKAKDLRKFMMFYQVWAHQIYPRAKFRDVIRMAEKTCHSKRLKVAVAEWRNDGSGEKSGGNILSGMTLDDEEDERVIMHIEEPSPFEVPKMLNPAEPGQTSSAQLPVPMNIDRAQANRQAAMEKLARKADQERSRLGATTSAGLVLEPYEEEEDAGAEYIDDFGLD